MKKINVAELLRDCPSGMELDCTMYENVYFDQIFEIENCLYSIGCYTIADGIRTSINFTKFGEFNTHMNSKCLIFPKGKTSWEGFVPPGQFKDGDIVVSSLGHIHILKNPSTSYIFVNFVHNSNGSLCKSLTTCVNVIRLATEEEKEKLFEVIKDNGYKWNEETKTLEKLIEPKFKVGNWYQCTKDLFFGTCVKYIAFDKNVVYYCAQEGCLQDEYGRHIAIDKDLYDNFKLWTIQDAKEETKTLDELPKFKVGDRIWLKENHNYIYPITGIKEKENKYECGVTFVLRFSEQDNWELVPNKFNINTLVPFESRVLARDNEREKWHPAFWGFYDANSDYPYKLVGCIARYCIPYEGNEHLRGKTGDCDKYFKTWK